MPFLKKKVEKTAHLSLERVSNLPAKTRRHQNTHFFGHSIQIFLRGCSCQATGGHLPPAKGVMIVHSEHGGRGFDRMQKHTGR